MFDRVDKNLNYRSISFACRRCDKTSHTPFPPPCARLSRESRSIPRESAGKVAGVARRSRLASFSRWSNNKTIS